MLQVDPTVRPEIDVILQTVEAIAFENCSSVDLNGPIAGLSDGRSSPESGDSSPSIQSIPVAQQPSPSKQASVRVQPSAPPPPTLLRNTPPFNQPPPPLLAPSITSSQQRASAAPAAAASSVGVFGFLKGGAGNLFSKVKDASSRVLESMNVYDIT